MEHLGPLILNLAPTGTMATRAISPMVPLQPREIVRDVLEAANRRLDSGTRNKAMARIPVRAQATDVVLPPLRDRVRPGLAVLFVGINPGVRSALTGHHFAGYSNRFWKLLYDSGLVPERLTYADDDRLPGFGYGITNLVPRATSGINDLAPADYAAGRFVLERKIRRLRPRVVALVGITLAYALVRDASAPAARNVRRRRARNANRESAGRPLGIGPRNETLGGRPVFVLPNPSGRNANFTYAEMLAAFVALRRWLEA